MNREQMIDKYNIYPITQHPDYQQDLAYDIDDVIDIINDFQSRTCENCKHYDNSGCLIIGDWDCYNDEPCNWMPPLDFGCLKFERKDKW